MSTHTPNFDIEVPSPLTLFRNLGAELLAFGMSVDDVLTKFDYHGKDPNLVLARVAALEAKFELLRSAPFAIDTAPAVASVGWTVTDQSLVKMGRMRQLRIVFMRSGAAISVPVHGNIANSTVALLKDVSDYPVSFTAMSSGSGGRLAVASLSDIGGNANLSAVAPGGNITTDETFELNATYIAKEVGS